MRKHSKWIEKERRRKRYAAKQRARKLSKAERRERRERRKAERSQDRERYVRHHIIPRARRGGNSMNNLVWLRAGREEAIHRLFGEGRDTMSLREIGELLVRKGAVFLRLAQMKERQTVPGHKPQRRDINTRLP